MKKISLTLSISIVLFVLTLPSFITGQENFGSFSQQSEFTVQFNTGTQIEGFCVGKKYIYAIRWHGNLVKIDTVGYIIFNKFTQIGYSAFYGAICFDQDTIWVVHNGEIFSLDTSGTLLNKKINFQDLGLPFYGGDIGGIAKDDSTFWLLEKWTPVLFQIDRKGNLLQQFATSWLDFWSPNITIWGNKILKITDSHTPTNTFDTQGVLAFNKTSGTVTDVWDIPKDFSGNAYIGISAGKNYLWAAQYNATSYLLTVHKLQFPNGSPVPEIPAKKWGDFEIVDWLYCPITPAMIEGLYGFGYDKNRGSFWFGNGIYDVVGAAETDTRYLSIFHFSRENRLYDIAVHNDTLWGIHYWAGWYSATVSNMILENDSLKVLKTWETGLEQAEGIATDGKNIWVSGRDTVLTSEDRNNHIIKFDLNGNQLDHFVYSDDNDHNYEDLTWHQGGLWAITRSIPFGDKVTIQEINPNTGEVLKSYATGWTTPSQYLHANLASDGTNLVTIGTTSSGVFDYWGNEHIRILKLKLNSGTNISTLVNPISKYYLYQNYPNPFNSTTLIHFDVPKVADVKIKVYDILGHEVKTLVCSKYQPGSYTVIWDGKNENGLSVASGTYLVRMQTGEFVDTRKILLLK